MDRIVLGLFDTQDQADGADAALRAKGYPQEQISRLFLNPPGQHDTFPIGGDQHADTGTEDSAGGAGKGALAGGTVGLVVGAGVASVLVPGLGMVVGAGPLLAALGTGVGAYTGSLWGAMKGTNDDKSESSESSEADDVGVRKSGVLVAVHADDTQVEEAAAVLREAGAVAVERRESQKDLDNGEIPFAKLTGV